jgi:hypothetical protein|nr:MAG TPA: hypothetical protein [Inoviridae sp.]
MSEAPRKSNYKPRGEVISNEGKLLTEAVTSPHIERQATQGKLHKSKNKKNTEKENKNTNKQRTKPQRKSPEKSNAHSKKRKRAERYICEIYHASG